MRLPAGRVGQVRRRVADAVGLTELAELEQRLALLEEAMTENARLAGPLDRYLARIEADLVPVLERSTESPSD